MGEVKREVMSNFRGGEVLVERGQGGEEGCAVIFIVTVGYKVGNGGGGERGRKR